MSFPWQPDQVFIREPMDMQVVLSKDGSMPINSNFDFLVHYRNKMRRKMYPETGGLVGSHGEDWYQMREKVQQDMMRAKSAMFYLEDIGDITTQLLDFIAEKIDQNGEVEDLLHLTLLWSLKSITATFLDTPLDCFNRHLEESSDAAQFVNAVTVGLGTDLTQLAMGPPLWKWLPTPSFRRFDNSAMISYKISQTFVNQAAIASARRPGGESKEESVLQKLISRCGPGSSIPSVMVQDALMAGVDTTAKTAAWLLLDLARNPDKQQQLYKEIRQVVGQGNAAAITETQLRKMRYLKACLHESQRCNPTVTALSRRTQTDMVLAGHRVPEGVNVR